ncbi:MAG: protein kinase [Planctomycetota bacterium]
MRDENTTHPTDEQLADFLAGRLPRADQTLVESHVAECLTCCEILRSHPDDTLLHRMRLADTSFVLDDTQTGLALTTGVAREPSSDLPPQLVDHPRYRIVRQLGAGGMGVVYEAEHRMMERPVALKVISRQLVNNPEAIDRFRREVKAAARLSHRNIVTAHDAEQAGDLHFLVMEFVAGTSLSELVRQHGRLSVLHACNFVMQAAQGLQHASEHGMVHRDIKPQNLMRTPKGTIKILDFGLARMASEINTARLTRAGTALGTIDYIAPEQVEDSRHVDIRADIYSLGCTLYYLLAGHVPFPNGSPVDKIVARLKQTPRSLADVRDDIPPEVVHIVERMMAKDRAARFQTPLEVVDALRPFSRPTPSGREPERIANTPPTPPPKTDLHQISNDAAVGTPEQVDLFDISFADQPLATIPALAPPPQHRPAVFAKKQWLQFGAGIGVLALLLFVGVIFWPILHNALTGNAAVLENRDGAWVDLMSDLDPSNNELPGRWRRVGNELSVDATTGARLCLPYVVPEQYDFEVTFTRDTGVHSIALIFVAGSGQATYEIDAWGEHLAGIQCIRGETLQNNPGGGRHPLVNGTRYTALVQVRRDRVTVSLDGQPIMTYEGNGSDLSILDSWRLPSQRALGIGAYQSATTFHRIRVRPIDDF